ncbi:MAG: DMT family transporter [Pseudomonadales bacterium]
MNSERQAVLFALGAVCLWSTVATGFKLGLSVMDPAQLLFAGSLISSIVFIIAALPSGWPRRHLYLKEAALFGAINPLVYYLVLFEAYQRLPAQIAQPLNYTWAIALALLAVPLLGQRLSLRAAAGILLSYSGVLILLSRGRIDTLPGLDWFGVALALLSTLLWAGYWLLNARSTTPPAAFMASSFILATPVLGLYCLFSAGLPPLNSETLFYGAWVGLVEMGITFLLWQRALRLTRHAGRISQLIFLSPFLSLLLIDAVLEETVHPSSWVGLAVIVSGLLVAGRVKPELPAVTKRATIAQPLTLRRPAGRE